MIWGTVDGGMVSPDLSCRQCVSVGKFQFLHLDSLHQLDVDLRSMKKNCKHCRGFPDLYLLLLLTKKVEDNTEIH